MSDSVIICGREYRSHAWLVCGDYGGAGSVGLSNILEVLDAAKSAKRRVHLVSFQAMQRAADSESRQWDSDETKALRESISSKRPPVVCDLVGDWGSRQVYILASWKAGAELLDELDRYPDLNEGRSTEIRVEWESEAFDSWILSDLERTAWPDTGAPENSDAYNAMSRDEKFWTFGLAMERENVQPAEEYCGIWVDVDAIAGAWRDIIETELAKVPA